MHHLSYKSLFIIFFSLLIAIVVLCKFVLPKNKVSAAWWNDNWNYRQAINISSHTSLESNVYITATINIGSTTKAQVDDGDFRFIDQSGQSLDYFIVSGAGTTTISFHILIPSFPSGASTIFAYYGNPSAPDGFSLSDFSTSATNYTIGSYSAEEVGGGPIAYWKFDEGNGTTVYDSTGNQINGSLTSSGTGSTIPKWFDQNDCISNKCLYFSGIGASIGSWISFGNNSKSTISGSNITISLWFKASSVKSAGDNIIIWKNDDDYLLKITNGLLNFTLSGIGTLTYNGIQINKWYHMVASYDGSYQKIFLNGKEVASASRSGSLVDNGGELRVGRDDGLDRYFNGYIDDVKIYSYTRTPAQIKQDYNSRGSSKGASASFGNNNNSLSDGLVGYWKMDESVGTSIVDSSGNNNTGIISGTSWTNGKYGVGTSFGGTNNVILVSDTNNSLDLPNDFTFSFWVNPSSSGTKELIGKAAGGNYEIWQSNTNLSVRVNGSTPVITASSIFTYGQWVHIIIKYERSSGLVTIYQNGNYFTSGSNTNSASINNNSLQIGAYSDGTSYPFVGILDELRIYNRALSPSEITQLYEYAPGPVGYWDFEENTGTTVKDTSGNGTPLSLINSPQWTLGKIGSALSFNGNNQQVNSSSPASQLTLSSAGTIEGWVLSNRAGPSADGVTTNYRGIVGKLTGGGAGQSEYYLDWFGPSQVNGTLRCGVGGNSLLLNNYSFPLNQWVYVSCTWNSSGQNMYINGQSVTKNSSALTAPNISAPFAIGTLVSGQNYIWDGKIDDVKVYNYARTQKQIVEDMLTTGQSASGRNPNIYYKLDEGNGTIANNSGNGGIGLSGVFGTGGSAPSWTNNGKKNKSLSFDGSDDYFSIPDNDSLDTLNDYTLSMWVYNRAGAKSWPTLLNRSTANGANGYFWIYTTDANGSTLNFQYADGSATHAVSFNNALRLNAWDHVIFTFNNSTKALKLFINGKQLGGAQILTNSLPVDDGNLYIGTYNGSPTSYPFYGLIDEVKIYNYALTDDEVKQDYNQNSATQFGSTNQTIGGTTTSLQYCIPGDTSYCASPVAEYNFEENTGTTAKDTSGNNNSGTISGATWTIGQKNRGTGLNFNGSNDYISIPTYNYTTNATISVWVKGSYTNGNQVIIGSPNSISLGLYNIGSTKALIGSAGTSKDVGIANNFINDSWNHLAVVFDGSGTATYYCNGQLLSINGTNNWTWTSNAYIGRRDSGSYFKGQIDNVRIYNYARTPAQIAYDYNRGAPIGWWKLDECQGSTAYDSSVSGNNGAISIGTSGSQNSLGTCQNGTSAAWTNGASGKINSSLNFDGVDDFVNLGDPSNGSLDFGNNSFSYGFWIYTPSSAGNYDMPIYKGGASAGNAGYDMELGLGGWVTRVCDTDTTCKSISLGNETLNQWIHLMAVIDRENNLFKAYKNGVLVSQTATTDLDSVSNNNYLSIGGSNNHPFKGQIDDIRIYNYAITSEQVKQIYNGGATSFN